MPRLPKRRDPIRRSLQIHVGTLLKVYIYINVCQARVARAGQRPADSCSASSALDRVRAGADRVPTRSVRKYTPRAQLKPLGAPEPASGARETGGGGRPARLCQDETHVLAEQFGSTEHDAFRGSVSVRKYPRSPIPWTGRSTVEQDVRSATLISERTRERLPCPGRRRPRLQRARRTGREPWSLSSSDSRPAPAVRAPRSL